MSKLSKAAAKLALENPDLRVSLVPLLKKYAERPETTDIYPHNMDHGWTEPLAGGTDIMRRVQNQFRHEQGLPTRPDSETVPKVAAVARVGIEHMRKPYYEMSDGIIKFRMAVNGGLVTKSDNTLKRFAKELEELSTAVSRHLDRTYIWD